MRTCWDKLGDFKLVAKQLHDYLDHAQRVEMYAAPLGSSLMTNRHKSLTSVVPYTKSNKKRSSSLQPASNLLNGLGRSPTSMGQAFSTTPSLGGTSIGIGGGAVGDGDQLESKGAGAITSGRLQAHHQESLNMNSINHEGAGGIGPGTSGIGGLDTGVDINDSGGIDKQSAGSEFAQNTIPYSAMMASQQPQQAQSNTVAKRRPIARSIGLAVSTLTPSKSVLVYAEQSLNYCNPIERYNIKGTKGRTCSERRSDANSCETLCCGRGYKTEIREEKYTCDCKFQYCCVLKCNTCTRRKVIHKCL